MKKILYGIIGRGIIGFSHSNSYFFPEYVNQISEKHIDHTARGSMKNYAKILLTYKQIKKTKEWELISDTKKLARETLEKEIATKASKKLFLDHEKKLLKQFNIEPNQSSLNERLNNAVEYGIFTGEYIEGLTLATSLYNNIRNQSIILGILFEHQKQRYNLSCEANSTSEFLSFILKSYISEEEIINQLPINTKRPLIKGSTIKRGDPNKEFVGQINGIQHSSRRKMKGYGIYAKGIQPIIQKYVEKEGYTVEINEFSQKVITDSLINQTPILFRYVKPLHPSNKIIGIQRTTDNNEKIQGYIGQHVGLIVGAEFNNLGEITDVYFYEGKSFGLQKKSFNEIAETAGLLNETITVRKQ